jgi:hypothetical protein
MKKGGKVKRMATGGLTDQERQEIEDAKTRKKEESGSSTKKDMGEGKIDMGTLKKGYEKLKDLIMKKANGGVIRKNKGGTLTDSSGEKVRSSDGEEVTYGKGSPKPEINESIWDLSSVGELPKVKKAEPKAEPKEETKAEPAAPKKFGAAFAEARKSGAKTFEFNGKQYTTQLKEDAPKKVAKKEVKEVERVVPEIKQERVQQPGDEGYSRQSFGDKKGKSEQRQQGSDASEEIGKPPKKKLPVSENMWFQREAMGKNYSPLKAKNLKKGGLASSASRRGDGIAQRGKTKGRIV